MGRAEATLPRPESGYLMAFGFSRTNYSPIAVDFGSDSIKVLQVVATDPPQLVAAASETLPAEARTGPAARQVFFADTLRKLIKSQGFKGSRAVCSIPAYQTLVQHVQVQRGEHDDIEGQIGLHLRQRLNVDPTRMVMRHFEAAQIVRDGTPKQEIICLAASRDSVMQHVETVNRAKLDVVGIHCEPIAILKAFEHLMRGAEESQRTLCFIDIGGATTKVAIARGGQMMFAKTIHAAGEHLNKQYAKTHSIDVMAARDARIRSASTGKEEAPAAEAVKPEAAPAEAAAIAGGGLAILEAQIAAERRPAPRQVTAPQAAQPSPDANEAIDCLIDELQLCVRYHQTLFPNNPIDKLVFLGGESRHVATCQRIARSLRIGAQLGDPLARLVRAMQRAQPTGLDLREPQPGWAVPVGLCLCESVK